MADIQGQISQLAGAIRKLGERQALATQIHQQLQQEILLLRQRPKSITEQIDAIVGRRIEFAFSGETTFTTANEGQRGEPVIITISQDGPFVMTHYPMVLWRPSAPTTATTFGQWRPVSTFPLPDQVVDTDIIDLMYEMQDSGTGRNFQNAPRGPMFSRPDNFVPLPVPTMFAPNATIQFTPTYNSILFNGATPPTEGILHVDLPGYRIVNL